MAEREEDFAQSFAAMLGMTPKEPEEPGEGTGGEAEADKPDAAAEHLDLVKGLLTQSPAEKQARDRAFIESLLPDQDEGGQDS
jgi:hypothetical protein